ncbi:hypothetical protein [uncultured Desulfovibrio sp.]|uniref:hypothetical protein n=1 Tax=uncultured Desulfovibrio sp. TaxID=167968 RepID=UPI00260B2517|nr:hypothetical protein [uncultured Desulfovibrio sp.]
MDFFSSSQIQEIFQRGRAEQIELDDLEKLLPGQPEEAVDFLVHGSRWIVRQGVHLDVALFLAEQGPGESDRQSLMVMASRLNSLDLKRNLCFGAFAAHWPRISANRAWEKPQAWSCWRQQRWSGPRFSGPSDTGGSPPALRQRRPSRMERPRKLGKSHGGELFLEALLAR